MWLLAPSYLDGYDTRTVLWLRIGLVVGLVITPMFTAPKRVDWSQPKLAEAVETIKGWGEDPSEYVDTTIKVQERKFDAWPSAIRDLFEPARTVKTGKPKFDVALAKKEAA